MPPRSPQEVIDDIQRIRATNNDTWMRLVRLAWELAPDRARAISAEIGANDEKIVALNKELVGHESPPAKSAKQAVLIPGGGILHTYAVKEALALGLVPIVTDRDPKCPCASIPGVEFHEIDCYDADAHAVLAAREAGRLAGAFCGGADTHESVAAASEVIDSMLEPSWVSRETSKICRNKGAMRDALLKAGVPSPKYIDPGRMGIFKPYQGTGSRGVYRGIAPPTCSRGHWEELLTGPEQSVEILLQGGESIPINIVDRYFAWVDDQPLEWGHTNPSRLPKDTQDRLYALCHQAASAVGADVGFFKCDTLIQDGTPYVLECTPRLSGGWDSQLSTPLSSGRNLLRYGLQLACGLPLEPHLLQRTHLQSTTVIHRPHLAGPI